MIRTFAFSALASGAILVSAQAAAQDSPVVGTWDTEALTDFGTFEAQLIVGHGDEGYTVEIVDAPMPAPPGGGGPESAPPPMESTISDVIIEGGDFAFTRNLTTPQGPMALNYTGNVEGDSLTATVNSQMGEIPVTGTRAE